VEEQKKIYFFGCKPVQGIKFFNKEEQEIKSIKITE
jgi:hypothetical protein